MNHNQGNPMTTPTDRRLLELAAKAAGIKVLGHRITTQGEAFVYADWDCDKRNWCPLTDDGDALRLAVKLRMSVNIGDGGQAQAFVAEEVGDGGAGEDIAPDPYAATRRAIVRAAAEIGKAIP